MRKLSFSLIFHCFWNVIFHMFFFIFIVFLHAFLSHFWWGFDGQSGYIKRVKHFPPKNINEAEEFLKVFLWAWKTIFFSTSFYSRDSINRHTLTSFSIRFFFGFIIIRFSRQSNENKRKCFISKVFEVEFRDPFNLTFYFSCCLPLSRLRWFLMKNKQWMKPTILNEQENLLKRGKEAENFFSQTIQYT